jgi:glycosyltransferase involved in cell wall biosynthesis
MNQAQPARPILFFSTVVHYGGSNQVTVSLARRLQTKRPVLVVDAYGNCREYLAALAAAGIETRVLSPHPSRGVIGGTGFMARYLRLARALPDMWLLIARLRRLLAEVRPAVVVVSGDKPLYALRWAAPAELPIVYYLMARPEGRAWYARRPYRRIDLLVGITQDTLQPALAFGPRRTAVVYNGLDVAEVEELARAPTPPLPGAGNALRLLFPASLIATKGQDIAIEALARARRSGQAVELWLSGNKPRGSGSGFPARLVERIAQLGLDDYVSFIGWQDNICAVMAAADAVILTSRSEGMPCALMQGMALQKPVLATRVGGIPELVRDGVDGLLVEVDDVTDTAAAIVKLADPDLRARMGTAGRARVAEEFSLTRQAENLLALLDGAAARSL